MASYGSAAPPPLSPTEDDALLEAAQDVAVPHTLPTEDSHEPALFSARRITLTAMVFSSLGAAVVGVQSARVVANMEDGGVEFAAYPARPLDTTDTDDEASLVIGATNKYTEVYGAVGVDYPWNDGVIVEPYRVHSFFLTGTSKDTCDYEVAFEESDYYGEGVVVRGSFHSASPAPPHTHTHAHPRTRPPHQVKRA